MFTNKHTNKQTYRQTHQSLYPLRARGNYVTQEQQNWPNTSLPATQDNLYVDNLVKSEHSGFGNCDNMYSEIASSEKTLDQTDHNICSSAVTLPESRKIPVVSDSLRQSKGPDGDDDDKSLYDDIGELVPADRKLGVSTLSLPALSTCNINPLEQGGEKIAVSGGSSLIIIQWNLQIKDTLGTIQIQLMCTL